MEVTGEHRFAAPRDVVWDAMLDPESLRASMPGCEEMTPDGEDVYHVVVRVGISAIKGTYRGKVSVIEQQPPDSYRLVVAGRGSPGAVQGDATMTLTDQHDGGTLVTYHGDVRAQGAIARLGSRLLGGAAKLMIGQFMKAMEKQVEARTP
jgi:carbon monoxide dehydrogenase subunit G